MAESRLLLTLLLCLVLPPPPAQAADLSVRTFTAHYDFTANRLLVARMERRLRAEGDGRYVFESKSEAAGMLPVLFSDNINESSVWDLADGRLRPLKYQYHHTGRKQAERHAVLDFDWKKGVVTNRINNDPWTMKVPTGALDKLLYQYAMMRDLKAGRGTLSYDIADGGELKNYVFERMGSESIATPLGTLQAVKLQRIHGSRRTVIWCAATLDYLPVRIEQHKDGKVLTMELREVEGISVK
ncbi:MAG: DUF3108 domain-containing protein [Gammaproteobacteria bacterium]|nr:DUF3108 domain-containing protein [Gammaproteobacteria bacterium]